MNKTELARKIQTLDGLSNEEKTALLELIRGHKKYGLVWEEKPEDIEEQLREELPVLTEVSDRAIISDNPDAPNHIIIEGDNLEALSSLAYTHAGKIDVIYIDPPYNTGNKDFIYNDSYVDFEDSYRHSKWLSFMSKRLRIAKKLLTENGVIFINIGSDEVAQLVLLCNDVFGENNQVAIISRVQKKGNGKGTHFSPAIDYILTFAKNKNLLGKFHSANTAKFPHIEISGPRKGEYYEDTKSLFQGSLDSRPNQRYYIQCPDGSFIIPPGNTFPDDIFDGSFIVPKDNDDKCWRWSWDSYLRQKDLLVFKKVKKPSLVNEFGEPSHWNVYTKRYQTDAEEKGKIPPNYIDDCINSLGTSTLSDLGIDFSFSKPCELISKLIGYSNKEDNIYVLDFFAGSGTTLHAVMQLNAEDGGKRTCILCTNNENGICENVTYERNKRVINGYSKPNGEAVEGLHDNNLRYYRTEFLPRERTAKNMRELVQASTGLLCIKNDLYTEAPFGGRQMNPKYARYFDDSKQQMLVIYEERAIPFIVNIIKTLPESENKIKVYVFSHGSYAYTDEFADVAERVEPCALPQAIYDAYIKVLPKRKPKFLVDELVTEIVETEQNEIQEQGTLDFGDNEDEKGGAE